jgi:hypothetical protein
MVSGTLALRYETTDKMQLRCARFQPVPPSHSRPRRFAQRRKASATARVSAGGNDLGALEGIMSFRYLEGVRILKAKISHTQKLVLLMLSHHADNRGYCFPSIPRLASECSMTERGIYKTVAALKLKKLISIRDDPHGSNGYLLLVDPMDSQKTPLNGIHPPLNSVHPPPECHSKTPEYHSGKLTLTDKGTERGDSRRSSECGEQNKRQSRVDTISSEKKRDDIKEYLHRIESELKTLTGELYSEADKLRRKDLRIEKSRVLNSLNWIV